MFPMLEYGYSLDIILATPGLQMNVIGARTNADLSCSSCTICTNVQLSRHVVCLGYGARYRNAQGHGHTRQLRHPEDAEAV